MKKYATITYLKEIEVSELDLENAETIFGRDIFDGDNEYRYIHKRLNKEYGWQGESQEIKIETLEKVINKLKEKGANYMEIVPHSDHMGYVFYGLEIRMSTDDEVKEFESTRESVNALKKQYNKLLKEAEAIKEKIRKQC